MWKWWPGGLLVVCMLLVGCEPKSDLKSTTKNVKDPDKTDAKKHDGWWCDEHGVPEQECSMCSSKVAKECKAKGDWCDKHDRAKSQCFICEPSLLDQFAARYEAKTGKKPPRPEDNMPETKGPAKP